MAIASLSYCFFFLEQHFTNWFLVFPHIGCQLTFGRLNSLSNPTLRALKQYSVCVCVCVFDQIYSRAADAKLVWPDLILITERPGIWSSGIGQLRPTWGKWYLQKFLGICRNLLGERGRLFSHTGQTAKCQKKSVKHVFLSLTTYLILYDIYE